MGSLGSGACRDAVISGQTASWFVFNKVQLGEERGPATEAAVGSAGNRVVCARLGTLRQKACEPPINSGRQSRVWRCHPEREGACVIPQKPSLSVLCRNCLKQSA
jgi:hypothetical protein